MTKILIQALLFGTIMMGCTSISNENNPNNNNENNSNNYKENNSNNNKFEVIISAELYENAPSDSIDINSLSINNDQLTINFSSSGCSGDSWDLILLDSGEITDSVPPKRFLRLSLNNSEFCEAYITKELNFDISKLQMDVNKVILDFKNSGESIIYEY